MQVKWDTPRVCAALRMIWQERCPYLGAGLERVNSIAGFLHLLSRQQELYPLTRSPPRVGLASALVPWLPIPEDEQGMLCAVTVSQPHCMVLPHPTNCSGVLTRLSWPLHTRCPAEATRSHDPRAHAA